MTTKQSAQRTTLPLAYRLWIAVRRAAARVGTAVSTWKNRQAVASLLSVDDHLLKDIGVTRQDVESVLSEPLFRDASWRLAERALDARRSHQALAREALGYTSRASATPTGAPASARDPSDRKPAARDRAA